MQTFLAVDRVMEQFVALIHVGVVHGLRDSIPVFQDIQNDSVPEEEADLFIEDQEITQQAYDLPRYLVILERVDLGTLGKELPKEL